ncbi:hypothetical protein P7K49_021353, partial [Saguinus oedipus]
ADDRLCCGNGGRWQQIHHETMWAARALLRGACKGGERARPGLAPRGPRHPQHPLCAPCCASICFAPLRVGPARRPCGPSSGSP